jgi:hypothetical protein
LIGFVVLSAAVLLGVAAAVIAFLVVGKKELHQHQLEHMEAVRSNSPDSAFVVDRLFIQGTAGHTRRFIALMMTVVYLFM